MAAVPLDMRWRIELFARLRAERGGVAVSRFRTQKTAALLGYLAYHGARSHPREALIELLWPACEPDAGRNSLSQAIFSLRQQLEPPDVARGSVIVASRAAVHLHRDAFTTDVGDFESALRSAGTASGGRRTELLERAIELYRGDLLPELFDDWVLRERDRLRNLFLRNVHERAGELVRSRDLPRALDLAHRAVAADPLHEEACRDLMSALRAVGEAPAALRQYRELEAAIERELGAAPSPATRALAREIEREAASGATPPLGTAGGGLSAAPPRARLIGAEAGPPAAAPPAGTVTFVLAEPALPPAADPAALARFHGSWASAPADAALFAFARASDAVGFSLALARAAAAGPSPGAPEPRIAIDTGEAELAPSSEARCAYRSAVLDHAACLVRAAHPGQILCSAATAAILVRELDAALRLLDLGAYRLRPNGAAERIFLLRPGDAGERAFPAPAAEPGHRARLPLDLTPFFGREDELSRLSEMLRSGAARLVSIVGPGGVGKTRLAAEAASRLLEAMGGAIWFVLLADIADPRLVPGAVVDAMRLDPASGSEPLTRVAEATLARMPRALVVLDNLEQLGPDGAAVVGALLERAPALTCLITSRRRLDLAGERVFPLLPLPTPDRADAPERLLRALEIGPKGPSEPWLASALLFVDRAKAARPDFQMNGANAATVIELVRRLEGIPLALSLAAARAHVLSPAQLLERLAGRLDLLAAGRRQRRQRHRTLRAAIDWSHDLLPPELRRLFARLSVFRGGFTIEAAEEVSTELVPEGEALLAVDGLAELCECSLLLSEDRGQKTRFRMLETLREYAAERLSAAEREDLGRRHAEFHLALAKRAAPGLEGPEQGAWLEHIGAEHDNFRAALAWWRSSPDPEPGLELAAALARYFQVRGHADEGRGWLADMLARAPARTRARLEALSAVGILSSRLGDLAAARAHHGEALAIARELGARKSEAAALNNLGTCAQEQGEQAAARAFLEESLALYRALGDWPAAVHALNNLGLVAFAEGDSRAARGLLEESAAIARERGDRRSLGDQLYNLAYLTDQAGEHAAARALGEEALALARDLGYEDGIAHAIFILGRVRYHEGDLARARALGEESLALFRKLARRRPAVAALCVLGGIAAAEGDLGRAVAHLEEGLALARESGDKRAIAALLTGLGDVALRAGDVAAARARIEESIGLLGELGGRAPLLAVALERLAAIAFEQREPERAARLLGAAAALRHALGAPIPPIERGEHERLVAAARDAMGEAPFRAALEAGHALGVEEAIAAAIGRAAPPPRE